MRIASLCPILLVGFCVSAAAHARNDGRMPSDRMPCNDACRAWLSWTPSAQGVPVGRPAVETSAKEQGPRRKRRASPQPPAASKAARVDAPKQFTPLLEERSNFQVTVLRFRHPVFSKPLILASSDVRFIVAEQLQAIGVEAEIVLEPARRDSAVAVAVAACLAQRQAPEAVVPAVAADHLIGDTEAFVESCIAAAEGARAGFNATLGVTPTAAATGHGRIQPGAALTEGLGHRVERLVEKPDAATAARDIARGYLWNSGNVLFRADVMAGKVARHAPGVLQAARSAVAAAQSDLDFLRHENEAACLRIGSVHRLGRVSWVDPRNPARFGGETKQDRVGGPTRSCLANPGRIDLELIEVQVGSYTGEDDIVRCGDVHGR